LLKDYYGYIDEIDRLSEQHPLGFKGAKELLKSFKHVYGTSADQLTEDDKGAEGLDCPVNTEYIFMNTEKDKQPHMNIKEINKSGPELYQKLGEMAKTEKLVLCAEKKEDMKEVVKQMIEKGNIHKEKII
jgi:hypothetical protein